MVKLSELTLDLALTDSRLGRRLYKLWEADLAASKNVPAELAAQSIADSTRTKLDVQTPALIPVEKALRKGAEGRFAEAGKIIREYLECGARGLVISDFARDAKTVQMDRRKAGGKKNAQRIKGELAPRDAKIRKAYDAMIEGKRTPREAPGILAKRYGLSSKHIKRILGLPKKADIR